MNSSTTEVKKCDAKITADQIKTSWQSNGPDDWYEIRIADKTKTRTQKQAKLLGQQILENQDTQNKLVKIIESVDNSIKSFESEVDGYHDLIKSLKEILGDSQK